VVVVVAASEPAGLAWLFLLLAWLLLAWPLHWLFLVFTI
jgi:hypothetical protein